MKALARENNRYGYRRIRVLLQREGTVRVNEFETPRLRN
jgi:hypothetical protein